MDSGETDQYQWAVEAKSVPPGTMLQVRIQGDTVLLVNVDGHVYAMSDLCTHSKCFLHNGKLKGKMITCPCHSARFDVTTGAVLAPPAREPLPLYSVKVQDDGVWVRI